MKIRITGQVEVFDMPPQGDVRLEVTPVPKDRYSLAPGHERLICIIHERDRQYMKGPLLRTRAGQQVEVAGFWAAREEAGVTRHYLNETTDVVSPR